MLGLSPDREMRQQWQRACELLLGEADVGALSKQIELALFYDAKLDLVGQFDCGEDFCCSRSRLSARLASSS
jgi:hypothetical protein